MGDGRPGLTVTRRSRYTAQVYCFRFDRIGGWANFTVCEQTGELSIQSDWGEWGHSWSKAGIGEGRTFMEFLRGTSSGYLSDKLLSPGEKRVNSRNKTLHELRKAILEQRRRGDIDSILARVLWDEADDFASAWEHGTDDSAFAACWELKDHFDELFLFFHTEESPLLALVRDELLPIFLREISDEEVDELGCHP